MAWQVKDSGGNVSVKLTNPHGVQLVTQTHFHRAPDKRFTEPEELLKERYDCFMARLNTQKCPCA